MCVRYVHAYTWLRIYGQLSAYISSLNESLRSMPGPPASYNVAPTQAVPVLRVGDGGIVPAMMRWWLVPSWAKSADESKYATFNARSEDAAAKPAFRSPYKRRRCVLPASGFYEWQKLDAKTKRPHYITRADGEPVYFAGLYDVWHDKLESCTILTTTPNAEMAELHKRMPCVLEPEQIEGWLDPSMEEPERIAEYLLPAPDGTLAAHPVGKRVGSPRNNDPTLIAHV